LDDLTDAAEDTQFEDLPALARRLISALNKPELRQIFEGHPEAREVGMEFLLALHLDRARAAGDHLLAARVKARLDLHRNCVWRGIDSALAAFHDQTGPPATLAAGQAAMQRHSEKGRTSVRWTRRCWRIGKPLAPCPRTPPYPTGFTHTGGTAMRWPGASASAATNKQP
jgi:hypothetical protein